MSKQKPHSDTSSRAERRRQEKSVQKAQKLVQANPQVQSQGISMADLLTKIGALTVENDFLRGQLNDLNIQNVEEEVERLSEEEGAPLDKDEVMELANKMKEETD